MNTSFNLPSYLQNDSIYKAISWFKAEGMSPATQLVRKTAALFAVVLLGLAVVGIYYAIKASITRINRKNLPREAAPATETAPTATDQDKPHTGRETAVSVMELAKKFDESSPAAPPKLHHPSPIPSPLSSPTLTPKAASVQAMAKKIEELDSSNPAKPDQRSPTPSPLSTPTQQSTTSSVPATAKKIEEPKPTTPFRRSPSLKKVVEPVQQISIVQTSPEKPSSVRKRQTAASGLETRKEADGFPVPFDYLSKMSWNRPDDHEDIIDRVNKSLTTRTGVDIPSEYETLKKQCPAKEELFYREAKMLAHHIALVELETDLDELNSTPSLRVEYKKAMFSYLRMLLDYLIKHKQFPEDLDRWKKSLW